VSVEALRERLRQSDWIVCAEALRVLDADPDTPRCEHGIALADLCAAAEYRANRDDPDTPTADAAAGADLRERLARTVASVVDAPWRGVPPDEYAIADALLPLVLEEAAKAWDEGVEALRLRCEQMMSKSPFVEASARDVLVRCNPHRAASPQPARDQDEM